MNIKSTSIALQNYFSQNDINKASDKEAVLGNFDDSKIENMNHFRMDSPLDKKKEPDMLSEAEQESLNLLFTDNSSRLRERYQLRLHSSPIGTFLDVKG